MLRGLLVVSALSLVAAPARAANEAEGAGKSTASLIYFGAVGNENLDPAEPQSGSSFAQDVLLAIYDTLVRLDPAGRPTPGLALSWKASPDLKEYTLTLRQGVVFHDGAPLDAEAVRKNLARSVALGGRAGGTILEMTKMIAAVETAGPHEVKLVLKAPSGQVPFFLGGVAGMMASPASLAGDAFGVSFKPVGAGPYRVRSFESNVRTILARNEEYWGGTKGRPATFEHHYVPDGRARLNALRSGQANLVLIDPRQIPEAKGAGLTVQVNEKNGVWDIYLNLSREALGKLKVRQAMMHAIDRQALADALSFGSSKPTSQLFAQSSPVYDPALDKIYPFDQAKARGLLAEAGYKDGVDLTQLLLNNSEYRQLGEALQAMVAEVGIRVKFDVVDASQFPLFLKPPGRGDYLMARWGGRADPLQVFQELIATGGTYNPGGVANPEIDVLIDRARGLLPENPERLRLLRQIARVAVESVSNVPLMTRSNVYAYKPGCIGGLPPYLPVGSDRFNDVTVAGNCR